MSAVKDMSNYIIHKLETIQPAVDSIVDEPSNVEEAYVKITEYGLIVELARNEIKIDLKRIKKAHNSLDKWNYTVGFNLFCIKELQNKIDSELLK